MRSKVPEVIITYGIPGSGKSNVLFKLAYYAKICRSNITLLSANKSTIAQDKVCERFCNLANIILESKSEKKLFEYNYKPGQTYYIDIGSNFREQKKVYDNFCSDAFDFYPIFIIPAYMDFEVVKKILDQYHFFNAFNIILTFCDFVSEERIESFKYFISNHKGKLIGINKSWNLNRGLELMDKNLDYHFMTV